MFSKLENNLENRVRLNENNKTIGTGLKIIQRMTKINELFARKKQNLI